MGHKEEIEKHSPWDPVVGELESDKEPYVPVQFGPRSNRGIVCTTTPVDALVR